MDELFQNPNDEMEVDPADLGPALADVMTITLAKKLAGQYEKPWTDKQESELQEKISALVAAAEKRGLKSVRVIVIRPYGQQVS